MTLVYIAPNVLSKAHAEAIKHSIHFAPKDSRYTLEAVVGWIADGSWKVFEFGDIGVLTVAISDNVLHVTSMSSSLGRAGYVARSLMEDLKRLAADWGCDTVETICYSPRHAQAIVRLGGKIESIQMRVKVGD